MRSYLCLLCFVSLFLVDFCKVSSFQPLVCSRITLKRCLAAADDTRPTTDHEEEKNDDGVVEKNDSPAPEAAKKPKDTSMSLVEYAERERQAARKLQNKLLLPNQIGKAINYALYAFIIVGFLLELSGYGYVRTENGIKIGTLEERDFQREMMRVVKPTKPIPTAPESNNITP